MKPVTDEQIGTPGWAVDILPDGTIRIGKPIAGVAVMAPDEPEEPEKFFVL